MEETNQKEGSSTLQQLSEAEVTNPANLIITGTSSKMSSKTTTTSSSKSYKSTSVFSSGDASSVSESHDSEHHATDEKSSQLASEHANYANPNTVYESHSTSEKPSAGEAGTESSQETHTGEGLLEEDHVVANLDEILENAQKALKEAYSNKTELSDHTTQIEAHQAASATGFTQSDTTGNLLGNVSVSEEAKDQVLLDAFGLANDSAGKNLLSDLNVSQTEHQDITDIRFNPEPKADFISDNLKEGNEPMVPKVEPVKITPDAKESALNSEADTLHSKPVIEVFEDSSVDETTGVKTTTKMVTSKAAGQSEDASKKWSEATEERVDTKTSPHSKEMTTSAKKESNIQETLTSEDGTKMNMSMKSEKMHKSESQTTSKTTGGPATAEEDQTSMTAQDLMRQAEAKLEAMKSEALAKLHDDGSANMQTNQNKNLGVSDNMPTLATSAQLKQAVGEMKEAAEPESGDIKEGENAGAQQEGRRSSMLESMTSALSSSFSYVSSVFSSSSSSCAKSDVKSTNKKEGQHSDELPLD